jgi:hypothetical protein
VRTSGKSKPTEEEREGAGHDTRRPKHHPTPRRPIPRHNLAHTATKRGVEPQKWAGDLTTTPCLERPYIHVNTHVSYTHMDCMEKISIIGRGNNLYIHEWQ